MADNDTSIFGDLYEYIDSNGTVKRIPDTDALRGKVAEGFKKIFGNDFSVAPETPNGLLINAIALGLFDAIGICAQNVNGLNLDLAVGSQLDILGNLHGVWRHVGESDAQYRQDIRDAIGKGGVYQKSSIIHALEDYVGVDDYCVLENNQPFGVALPKGASHAVNVNPHSLYISIVPNKRYVQDDLANQIVSAKAPGCGYTLDNNAQTQVTATVTGPYSTETEDVEFNIAKPISSVVVNVKMDASTYSGTDIEGDVSSVVKNVIMGKPMCTTITPSAIISAIAVAGFGTATSVSFTKDSSSGPQLIVHPYEYVLENNLSISVSA